MAKTTFPDDDPIVDQLSALAAAPYENKTTRSIWLQIYDRLSEACRIEIFEPGARLPGEYKLAELFGVNRLTMRNALTRLQREGFLHARKGVGIFVRPPAKRYVIKDNMRFANSLVTTGAISTQTLSVEKRRASPEAQKYYELPPGAHTVELHRIRLLDDAPLYYAVKEFSLKVLPRFFEVYGEFGSVIKTYEAHGITTYKRSETRVLGGFASRAEAEALHLSPKTPVIYVHSINADPSGRVIELNRGCWPLTSVELVFPSP